MTIPSSHAVAGDAAQNALLAAMRQMNDSEVGDVAMANSINRWFCLDADQQISSESLRRNRNGRKVNPSPILFGVQPVSARRRFGGRLLLKGIRR